jgi:CheY-like chemotaxis protein
MKVLIIDDDTICREKLRICMEPYATSHLTHNGFDALVLFRQALQAHEPFDLIFLDLCMPGMEGKQVLEQMRQIEKELLPPRHQSACIIMVTATAERAIVMECLERGCNDYVIKPFVPSNIQRTLKKNGLLPGPPSD